MCNGTLSLRIKCRERSHIRAERLEEPVWSEVKRMLQNPDLIVAGIDTLDSQDGSDLEEEIVRAERDLRSIQMEEDRAIRLFVSGRSPRPNWTTSAGSSPSGWRAPGPGWTIAGRGRLAEPRGCV